MFKYILFALCLLGPQNFAANGVLKYEKFYRLNTPAGTMDTQDWLGFSFQTTKDGDPTTYFVEGDFKFFLNNNRDMNYSVPEAYLQFNNENSITTLGRRHIDWDEQERFWHLGKMNGLQGFKLLDEKEEGIFGYHFDYRLSSNIKVSFIFSYIHIPVLNPAINVDSEGKITSTSEWYRKPPTETFIAGQRKDIFYEMNTPKVKDVIFKKTIGANISYNWLRGGEYAGELSFYAIYKPENNLRINADASFDTSINKVRVVADPVVNHHLVFGPQIKQKFEHFDFVTGIQYSDPNAKLGKDFNAIDFVKLGENGKQFESEFFTIEPNYDREIYYYATINYKNKKFTAKLSTIHNLTNVSRGNDDFFSDTVKWRHAIGGQFTYNFFNSVSFLFDMKHDITRGDNILRMEGFYYFAKDFGLKVGTELLLAPKDSSYWSAYRANDTVYLDIGFHF